MVTHGTVGHQETLPKLEHSVSDLDRSSRLIVVNSDRVFGGLLVPRNLS